MNQFSRMVASAATLALLTACGGGGDDGSPTPNTAPATASGTKYSQADIQSVAAIGASSVALGYKGGIATAALGAFLVPHTSRTAGSEGSTVVGCGSLFQLNAGTYTYSSTKSAIRKGFGVGDQFTVIFKGCKFNDTSPAISGTAIYVATTSLSGLGTTQYDYPFDVMLIGFAFSFRGANLKLDGVANMQSKFLNSGNAISVTQKLTVPLGQTLRLTVNGQVVEYGGGATFVFTENSQSGSGVALDAQLNGPIKFTQAGQPTALEVATPTVLAGSADAQANFFATAGTLTAKDTARNVATRVTLNGSTASISGDTDGDGSLDLNFTRDWAALIAP